MLMFSLALLGCADAATEAPDLGLRDDGKADSGSSPTPELVMTSPDSATATYADTCSNGGNNDATNRTRFISRMIADPRSQLAQLRVALLAEIAQSGEEPRGEGVVFGDWQLTGHERIGCGENHNSYSAFVLTLTGGNSNYLVAHRIATIDDTDISGLRTLTLRKIQPIDLGQ